MQTGHFSSSKIRLHFSQYIVLPPSTPFGLIDHLSMLIIPPGQRRIQASFGKIGTGIFLPVPIVVSFS
jgi:hypothetical protein